MGFVGFLCSYIIESKKYYVFLFPSGSFQGLEKHCIGKSYGRHLLECFFCIEVGMGEAKTLEQADKINSALLQKLRGFRHEPKQPYLTHNCLSFQLDSIQSRCYD